MTRRRIVRAEELAEEMGVSVNLLYRLCRPDRDPDERMPHYRLGGALRFDYDEALDWAREQAMGGRR